MVVKPDPLGLFDIFVGIFLLFTVSPLPPLFAQAHAGFLILKGIISLLPLPPIPPLYILGAAADILSAAILLTGQPPFLIGLKEPIAALLGFKGVISLATMSA